MRLQVDRDGFRVSRRLVTTQIAWASVTGIEPRLQRPSLVGSRNPLLSDVLSAAWAAGNFRWMVIAISLDQRKAEYRETPYRKSRLGREMERLLGRPLVSNPSVIEIDTANYGEDVAEEILTNLQACWQESKSRS